MGRRSRRKKDRGGSVPPERRREGKPAERPSPEAAAIPEGEAGRIRIPITDALDLHTIAPRDIPGVVEEYLWEAARQELREVRIIHGKGIGFQRNVVAGILERHPAVESFHQASADRGHWGATIVLLHPLKRRTDPSPG